MTIEVTISGIVSGDPQSYVNRAGDLRVDFTVVSTYPGDPTEHGRQRYGSLCHLMACSPLAEWIQSDLTDGMAVVVRSHSLDIETARDHQGVPRPKIVIQATDVRLLDE